MATFTGTNGNDTLEGGPGDDQLFGGLGNDLFLSSEGDDHFDGGPGADGVSYYYAFDGVTIDLAAETGDDGSGGTDSYVSIEIIYGSNLYDDVLSGGTGADTLYGNGGNDILSTGTEDDLGVTDALFGGEGDDLVIFERAGGISFNGGTGYDTFEVRRPAGTTTSWNIGDTFERFLGGDSNDTVQIGFTTNLGFTMEGRGGSDTLFGSNGADSLYGGDGNDTLGGGNNNDSVYGGGGNDGLYGGAGNDLVDGGEGTDTLHYLGHRVSYVVTSNIDGSITVTSIPSVQVGGTTYFATEGVDTLTGVEHLRFIADGVTLDMETALVNPLVAVTDFSYDLFEEGDFVIGESLALGNLLDNDLGDDVVVYAAQSSLGDLFAEDLAVEGGSVLAGLYGELTLSADGSYSYTLDQSNADVELLNDGDTLFDEFFYWITDAQGQTASAWLVIPIIGAYDSDTPEEGVTIVGTDDHENFAEDDAPDGQPFTTQYDDVIYGFGGFDSIYAGAGDDQLYGGDGNDYLFGDVGNDSLFGGDGDDELGDTDGDNLIDGGDGIDRAYLSFYYGHLDAGTGINYVHAADAVIDTGYETQTFVSIEAVDIFATAFDDVVVGSDYDDVIDGTSGNDTIYGGAGMDVLFLDFRDRTEGVTYTHAADGVADTGNGITTFFSMEAVGLNGSAFDDVLKLGPSGGSIQGRDGDDVLIGSGDIDFLFGDDGDDVLTGAGGDDYLYGDEGEDIATFEGRYADYMVVETDNDFGTGRPRFTVTDSQAGRDGEDRVIDIEILAFLDGSLDLRTGVFSPVTVVPIVGTDEAETLAGDDTDNSIEAGGGDDELFGWGGDDTILGEEGNDSMGGQTGNDALYGGDGNDIISGGEGDDTLSGGAGQDTLIGGNGADSYLFDVLDTTHDRVKGYVDGEDLIVFDRAAFTALADLDAGALDASVFVLGSKALTADQHIIYNQSKGHLLYDADGSGAGAAVIVAAFTNKPAIDAGDIQLI